MKSSLRRLIVALTSTVALAGCGGGGGGEDAAVTANAVLGTICSPMFSLSVRCPGALCKSGVVFGDANETAGPYSISFPTSTAMCTKSCTAPGDCQGMSFATANRANLIIASEAWTCLTTAAGSYCSVSVKAPAGGGNSCSPCGGAFCSGNCIGCPQCS
jgi:hypothetical protein